MEILQTLCHWATLLGLVVAALGGFGSYYFGKNIDAQKADEFNTKITTLIVGNQKLQDSLKPFEEVALQFHPSLEREEALQELQGDIERLKKLAAKYEYKPIQQNLKENLITKLSPIAVKFAEDKIQIDITYETWASIQTKQFVGDLATLLKEANFKVDGPKTATIYLACEAYALEWGYNESQLSDASNLFDILSILITPGPRFAKRATLKVGQMRIHLGGQVVFHPGGTVSVE